MQFQQILVRFLGSGRDDEDTTSKLSHPAPTNLRSRPQDEDTWPQTCAPHLQSPGTLCMCFALRTARDENDAPSSADDRFCQNQDVSPAGSGGRGAEPICIPFAPPVLGRAPETMVEPAWRRWHRSVRPTEPTAKGDSRGISEKNTQKTRETFAESNIRQ